MDETKKYWKEIGLIISSNRSVSKLREREMKVARLWAMYVTQNVKRTKNDRIKVASNDHVEQKFLFRDIFFGDI